jgi:hypothetical protein
MTELIKQRTNSDCAIACVAMATTGDYDAVVASNPDMCAEIAERGCTALAFRELFEGLGYDLVKDVRIKGTRLGFWETWLWGRKAIINVTSLNMSTAITLFIGTVGLCLILV